MWNLDDENLYFRLLDVTIPHAFTWGSSDLLKREAIRHAVAARFPDTVPEAQWWAFRLYARKSGSHGFDVESVPKLIVDSFARSQIVRDSSKFHKLALYDDDKVDHVRIVQVAGEPSTSDDSTRIEIFGRKVL